MDRNLADAAGPDPQDATAGRQAELSAAEAEVRSRWRDFADRHGISAPTIAHVSHFLASQYGINWDEALVRCLAGDSRTTGALDMTLALRRMADLLLDSGMIAGGPGA
jgi:hypothetical protein